jgi:predicted Zn-dependent protease
MHAEHPPELDPKRIINESNSFLKEREPEMNAEEYAIYEKVTTMLTTNVDLAVKMLEAMMTEKEPPSPAFEFILGNAYYAAKQVEQAEQCYRSAVKRYPSFLRAWSNLGVLYYTSARYADARPCFSQAVMLGDRDPVNFGLLGYCLEKEGDTVSAEMAYLQAVSGDPANTDWKEGLLRIYIDGKQYGRAEPLVRSLIKAKPAETRYWLDYAGILLAERRKVEAMVVLEEAAAAGAAGPDELTLLGDLYAEQNLTAQAIAIYEKVRGAERAQGEEKLLQFARVLIAADKLPEAEQTLAAITGELTPPARIVLLQTRADLAMARKRWPEARQQIEALLALAPLNGRGLLTLGRTYLEENNVPRATVAFEAAYRIPDAAYQASLELANIEVMNRHFAKSAEYLEKALSIEKTDAISDYLARVRALARSETQVGDLRKTD